MLDDLDFSVPVGQKVAILGPSGSGKTTLLRVLMTLERPDSGHIEVFGELLGIRRDGASLRPDTEEHTRSVRRQIGMVFQHFNLFPHMTALQNITEAPTHVLGMKRDEARQLAMQLLEMVGMVAKADRFPRQLSGGEQQRVAIARALALRPRIMLLDEITSALDPELVREVLLVVRRLAMESGMTMLIVTHEVDFARAIADRVIFMEAGSIVEDGIASQVFGRPRSPRTAKFLAVVTDRAGLSSTPIDTRPTDSESARP